MPTTRPAGNIGVRLILVLRDAEAIEEWGCALAQAQKKEPPEDEAS